MKTRLIPVLMIGVLTATAAQARPNDDDGERPRQRAGRPQMAAPQQQPQPQPQSQPQPQPPQPQQPQGEPRERERSGAAPPRGGNPGRSPNAGGNGAQGPGQRAGPRAGLRPDDRAMPGNRPPYSNQNPNWQADRSRVPNWADPRDRNPQRNWRDSQGRDWRANRGWYDRYRIDHFRFNGGRYFARQRYSVGGYAWPRGYTRRLWLAGEWLPSVFFIDGRYDLNDYWFYDLYEPPLGCRWTRVDNDALLIDQLTGEVLDVVYDLFW